MSETASGRLLIVGASARAAAMSAIRSGFEPWAADRFGDLDLKACGPSCVVDDYPAGLEQALSAAPPGPWLYTGALENRPKLIERLARSRRLYGNRGESLRGVRDPFRLADVLANAGLLPPRCARSGAELPRDGSWLRKPLASAGGCHIRTWTADPIAEDVAAHEGDFYFQQLIDGLAVGALYVGAERCARLLGVTRQLIGLDWCGLSAQPAHRFRYCGSLGPLDMAPALTRRFEQLGGLLAQAFDLQGLFGVDAILADGKVWPIEVNPRYTASVEVLERALGIHSIALHVAACGGDGLPSLPNVQQLPIGSASCCGKAILFAAGDTIVAPEFPAWAASQNRDGKWPTVADIPAGGTFVRAGQPIVSLLAQGEGEASVLAKLESLAASAGSQIAAGYCRR